MFAPAVLIAMIEKAKETLMAAFMPAPTLSPIRVKATIKTTKTTKTRY